MKFFARSLLAFEVSYTPASPKFFDATYEKVSE
jgi:hypothetical protein